jgi:hypothetical protein
VPPLLPGDPYLGKQEQRQFALKAEKEEVDTAVHKLVISALHQKVRESAHSMGSRNCRERGVNIWMAL